VPSVPRPALTAAQTEAIGFQVAGASGKYRVMLSSSESLFSSTSIMIAAETNCLPTEPDCIRVSGVTGTFSSTIYALPIEWSPGDKWGYRNTNYVILGILIHKITGERYDQFLHDRIFAPLGMTSTRLISDRDIIKNRSSGYEIDDTGQLKNQEWVSPTFNSTADGTLYFNVLDLAKWDEALYTTRLLTQASLDRIWTVYRLNNGKPNPANYGFGWEITQFHGHKLIEHGGAWQAFTCHISRYPDDSLTVVVLTNLDPGHSRPGLIAHLAAVITPAMTKRVQQTLAPFWPGGALTLVQREPVSDAPGTIESTFRISKGPDSMLIRYGRNAEGKIAVLGLSPDRPWE
jgi:CubicO group peptidase (beta-lactamase class C family)